MGLAVPSWQTPRTSYAITDGVFNTDFERIEKNILNLRNTGHPFGTAAGTNNYTVDVVDVLEIEDFVSIMVKIPNSNTGASTLNVNKLGAQPIVRNDGTPLGINDLIGGQVYTFVNMQSAWQILGRIANVITFGTTTSADGLTYDVKVPNISAIQKGTEIKILLDRTNSGSAYVRLNGSTPIKIVSDLGGELAPAVIKQGQLLTLVYNGTYWQIGQPLQYIPVQTADEAFQRGVHSVPLTNTGNTYTASAPGVAVLAQRTLLMVIPTADNSGPATLNVNNTGALPIKLGTSLLVAGDLKAYQPTLIYRLNDYYLMLPSSMLFQTKRLDVERLDRELNLDQYAKRVVSTDLEGNPIDVNYLYPGTSVIAVSRVASEPDINGYYTKVVETFSDRSGQKIKTVTYRFTFLDNGLIATSDGGVVS